MYIALDIFCITVALTIPAAVELIVFIGVCFWVKPISWSVMRRGAAFSRLWNSPQTSDLTADATTCFRILHSVWIEPFSGGGIFGDFSGFVGSYLR